MAEKIRISRLMRLLPEWTWNYNKRRPMTSYNPARQNRQVAVEPVYTMFLYNNEVLEEKRLKNVEECLQYADSKHVKWINIDGINKADVEKICARFGVHPLVAEDILSMGQRAKMDEIGDTISSIVPMLYYNDGTGEIETEQVSIVLGSNFVLSFQEDPRRDVFDPVRLKLRSNTHHKIRSKSADYLSYSLIDVIVDSYFGVIEKINERIERLEDNLLLQKERAGLAKLSILRREIIVMRRNIGPVRELVSAFIKSDSDLLEEEHEKYYKDVYDHIIQANEYVDNHRDMLMNLQDLAESHINLKTNEVMKIFTIIATLLAPATVIGGIFGMNFDVIPLSHQTDGFWVAVAAMLLIPVAMLWFFKRKGWF